MLPLLLLIAVLNSAACDNVLSQDLQIDSTYVVLDDNFSYNLLKLFIGKGDEPRHDANYMEIDINHCFSIIGDLDNPNVKWGISCKDPAQNSCQVDDTNTKDDFYNFFLYKYKPASVHVRLNSPEKLVVDNLKKLPIRLHQGGQKWYLDTAGTLGLSPQSEFGNYLRAAYKTDVPLAIKYKATNPKVSSELLQFNSYVVLNPTLNATQIITSFTYAATENFWSLKGALKLANTEYNYNNINFILTSNANEIIQTIDAMDFCHRIQEVACNGLILANCNKTNADLTKLSNLEFTFNEKVFSFTPAEYTFYNDRDVLDCRVGDVGSLRSDYQVPPKTEFALGKMFFEKYIPLFTFNADGTAKLTFLNTLEVKEKNSSIWLILGIVGAVIAIAVILYIMMHKKENRDENYAGIN